ncbi:hypothetical protein Hanom_Chr03g00220981 [Helianthus anomalus]
MLAFLEKMHKVLDKMIKKSMNQHVDPLCQGCGGPHRYEDCSVAFRWLMPLVTQGTHWAGDDDWDLNRCMNDESVNATEVTNMETPLEDAEGIGEADDVEMEEVGVEEEKVEEDPTSDPELSDRELETIMDESVPPLVQQDVKLHWYSTPWYYGPEPIDDDIWNEDGEGVVEEMELEMPDYTTSPRGEETSDPLDKMEDTKIEEHVLSWE